MKLYLSPHAYRQITAYTALCDLEISGLGRATYDEKEEEFTLHEIVILSQEVTGGTTDLDEEAIAKWQYEKTKNGESLKEWCVWWHSHVNMQAFFSGRDVETIEKSNDYPFLVSLVSNKRDEHEARIDVFKPFKMTEKLDVVLPVVVDSQYEEECAKEIKEKVREKKSSSVGYHYPTTKTSTHKQHSDYSSEDPEWGLEHIEENLRESAERSEGMTQEQIRSYVASKFLFPNDTLVTAYIAGNVNPLHTRLTQIDKVMQGIAEGKYNKGKGGAEKAQAVADDLMLEEENLKELIAEINLWTQEALLTDAN